MEITYNVEVKKYTIKVADSNSIAVSKPETVFECLKGDFNPLQEEMYLLIMDASNKIIEKILISKGSSNALYMTPADILRNVLRTASSKFILAHNHPSGNTKPSEEDLTFTDKIKKSSKIIGLSLLDHIVFTQNEYFSFKASGLI